MSNIIFIALTIFFPLSLWAQSTNPYEVLQISPNSSNQEIKSAYRKLAMKFHPDRNKSPDAEEKFKQIKAAYEALIAPHNAGESDASSESLIRRYSEIVSLYNLSVGVFNGSITAEVLAEVQSIHDKMKFAFERFIELQLLSSLNPSNNENLNQLSKYNDFDLYKTLQVVVGLREHKFVKIYNMVPILMDSMNIRPDAVAPVDLFLSEFVKTIDSSERLRSFLSSSWLGFHRGGTYWLKKGIRERDVVTLYQRTIRQVLIGPLRRLGTPDILLTLQVSLYSAENFARHFDYLAKITLEANISALFENVARALLISNFPNVPYDLSAEKVDFILKLLESGISDKTKIQAYLEIANRNPSLFATFPALHKALLDIRDFSFLASRGLLNLERGNDPEKARYIDIFFKRFVNLQPALASEVLYWGLQTIELSLSMTTNDNYKIRIQDRLNFWNSYYNMANSLKKGKQLESNYFSKRGVEPFWERLIRDGSLKPKVVSCEKVFE